MFHFGSNSACISRFTFVLNYAVFSGGKLNERIFFPPPRQYLLEGYCYKGEQPLRRAVWKKVTAEAPGLSSPHFHLSAVLFIQGGNK